MELSVSVAMRTVAGGCLVALLLGAGACDAGTVTTAPPTASSSPAAGSPGFFGGTDLAWVEITIAMNEELLPLLELAPTQTANARVRALAADAKAGHERELVTLQSLHDQAKLPTENPHEGMPMPGMVTPQLVAEAAAAKGASFDKLLVQHLKAHLQQGVQLARSEEKAGVEPQTKALAAEVLASRGDLLAQLSGK
jgi:uncharacterized protein (DUF305 family)